MILVPEGMRTPEAILTDPIVLEGVHESFIANPHIVLPLGMRLEKEDDGLVIVAISVERQ